MNLEITSWNNIMDSTVNNIYIPKTNLNESIIDDSNYVSEDSVTLNEGSVEKDEDSLDYQNDDGNIDSITNSISDEFHDLNENNVNKDLRSRNMEIYKSNINEELKNNSLNEKEVILHNIIERSAADNNNNGEISSVVNTTETESDKTDKVDNSDDLNFYDCEDSESFDEKFPVKIIEQCDDSCLDYNNHDFVSCNWLISGINPDNVDDDKFDLENVFSFNKMELSNFKINNRLSLCLELSRKFPDTKKPNSYLNVCPSFQPNSFDPPIDFAHADIYSCSTPYSTKQKNHKKNETFSKSPVIISLESDADSSVECKNRTFNLEENPKEKSLVAPCLQIDADNHENKAKTTELVSSEISKLLDRKIPRNHSKVETEVVVEKPRKQIGSLLSIPSKSIDDASKNKSLLKLPMEPPKGPALSLKPPAALKKLFSRALLSRDSLAALPNTEQVKTRTLPPYDPTRRHTLTEEVLTNKQSSRPTSLIKPNEMKPPIGNCRIAKPIRPSLADKAQRSQPANQKESGIPKTVKSMKLQSVNQKNSKNEVSNRNQPCKIDECSQQPTQTPTTMIPPILSDNPPIISPTISSINNPLNRTFDREDFQILKSFTNNNNNNNNCSSESSSLSSDVTIHSSTVGSSSSAAAGATDSDNNNQSQISRSSEQLGLGAIYQLARREEENLKKHVNSSALTRQTVGFRSLKLPSQIKPRMTVVVPPPHARAPPGNK